jgi:hypothetical protein
MYMYFLCTKTPLIIEYIVLTTYLSVTYCVCYVHAYFYICILMFTVMTTSSCKERLSIVFRGVDRVCFFYRLVGRSVRRHESIGPANRSVLRM